MHYLLRFAFAIQMFVIGLVLTLLAASYVPVCVIPAREASQEQQATAQTSREYKMTTAGKLATIDGHSGSFTNYETSDGLYFSRTFYFYDSPKQATQKLQERIKLAQTIRREPVLDENGKRVGEKFIVKYQDKGAGILWTNGSTLVVVDSSSLDNLSEFEKDHKR